MSSSISKSKTAAKPAKKTTLSDREYVNQLPDEKDIAALKDIDGNEIARYLPIDIVQRDLDRWPWTTQNFSYQQYRDGRYSCVSASLELVIPWKDDAGKTTERKLVGGCNFIIASYAPNGHFVATAKSECIKNAASGLGKKFGRGLNNDLPPAGAEVIPVESPTGKIKPDSGILEQFKKAKERGDKTAMAIIANVYEIKTEDNGNETV